MTRTLLTSGLAAALVVAAVPSASAQPTSPPTEDAKKAEAKALYETGNTHYNLGEYDQAVAAFKKAYELSQAPGLLFNIAQSYRLKKDYEQASHFYETYLRLKPDAANRADVEARIAEMKTMLEEQKKMGTKAPIGTVSPDGTNSTPTTTTTTTPTTTTPTTTTPTEPKDIVEPGSGKGLKLAGLTTAGVGGALIITGVVFGMMAKGKQSDLEELNTSGGAWDQDAYDAGKRNNTIAIASLAIGGAAVVAGGVMFYLGYSKEKKASSVAVVPTKGGGTFTVGWQF